MEAESLTSTGVAVGPVEYMSPEQVRAEATPFIQTKDETSLPACLLEDNHLAFFLGSPGKAVVAVASLADGHILSSAWPLRATLWRFHEVANGRQ